MEENKKRVKIRIQRAEGTSAECRIIHTATSWKAAAEILKRMAITAPDCGYDKTDFEIVFSNGDKYIGIYDLKSKDRIEGDLFQHVKSEVEFHAGRCVSLPSHISKEQYIKLIGGRTGEYVAFLENVLYPSAEE